MAASVAKRIAVAPTIRVLVTSTSNNFQVGGYSSFASLLQNQAQGLQRRQQTSFRALLDGSEFSLSLRRRNADASDAGACLDCFVTLWGAVDYRHIEGQAGDIGFNGRLLSGQIGADTGLVDHVLVGVSATFSEGKFNYSQNSAKGTYNLNLNSVNPYIGVYLLNNKLNLWATYGYGTGAIDISNRGTSPLTSG